MSTSSTRLTERELLTIAHILGCHYDQHPDACRLVARIRTHIDDLPMNPTQPKETP